jgi:hypothetical protein
MDFPKGMPEQAQAIVREMEELQAKAAREPAPPPPEVGDFMSDQMLERVRWVVPGLWALGGIMMSFIFGLSGPLGVAGWLGLVWAAGWIASVPLLGPERIEVDRNAHTITIKRLRPFRPTTRVWQFVEIAGFDLHEHTGRLLRDSGEGLSIDRSRTTNYWIRMRLIDGNSVDLFRKNYATCFKFSETSKRRVLLETMTGKTRAQPATML